MDIKSIEKLKQFNPDLKFRKLNDKTLIIYFETICKSDSINEFLLKPISKNKIETIEDIKKFIPSGNIKDIKDESDLYNLLYSGFTIICINNKFVAFEQKDNLIVVLCRH